MRKYFAVIIRSRQFGILDVYETDSIRSLAYVVRHIERLCAREYPFVSDFTFTLATHPLWRDSSNNLKETNQ